MKTSKTPRTCNRYSMIWAGLIGCLGSTRRWRRDYDGRAVFICDACLAHEELTSRLTPSQRQDHLHALQQAAGVADYRRARCRRRPDGTVEILSAVSQ